MELIWTPERKKRPPFRTIFINYKFSSTFTLRLIFIVTVQIQFVIFIQNEQVMLQHVYHKSALHIYYVVKVSFREPPKRRIFSTKRKKVPPIASDRTVFIYSYKKRPPLMFVVIYLLFSSVTFDN